MASPACTCDCEVARVCPVCLAMLTNNEKCHFFAQYNLFGANVYMCYDYVHLDNLSDISAYRNHNVQQCKMRIPQKTHTA